MTNIRLRVLPRIPPVDGREIELRDNGEYIQQRYVGEDDSAWVNVVDLDDITGPQGTQGPQGDQGPQGEQGNPGPVGIVWQGAYSALAAYTLGDVVRDQDSSWVALQPTTGNAPPSLPATSNDYWELLAQAGADGTMTGPVSSTDNAVVRFNGAGGATVQDSVVTISDTGLVAGATNLPRADSVMAFTATEQGRVRQSVSAALKGQIYGLALSNNASDATNDIDIAVGEAASTETDPVLMILSSALTKRLDAAWAVGSGNGGLDTGSIANTTYHIWLIQRSDTGVVDALFSASASAPTMPANYDRKRRIGSIIRASGAILAFSQDNDHFRLTTEILERSSTTLSSSWAQLTLAGVPAGVRVRPLLSGWQAQTTGSGTVGTELAAGDQPSTPTAIAYVMWTAFANDAAYFEIDSVLTDTSARIRFRVYTLSGTPALSSNVIRSRGWVDTRGRAN